MRMSIQLPWCLCVESVVRFYHSVNGGNILRILAWSVCYKSTSIWEVNERKNVMFHKSCNISHIFYVQLLYHTVLKYLTSNVKIN